MEAIRARTVAEKSHSSNPSLGAGSMDRIDGRRLGIHLKRLREERRLTLGGVENLSAGFGERINKTYLFRVERGTTVPSIPRLRILAKVYRVKLAHLLEALESAFEEQERGAGLEKSLLSSSFEELRQLGIDAEREGDFSRATLLYNSAWERASLEEASLNRPIRVATARLDLAIVLRNAGRLEIAREHAECALEQNDLPPDLLDRIRLTLSTIYRRLGQINLSRDFLSCLLSRENELSADVLGGAHSAMGSALLQRDSRAAARHYRKALSVARHQRNTFEECKLMHNIALAETKAGNLDRALRILERGLILARRKDFNFSIAKFHTALGKVHYLGGQTQEARSCFRQALDVSRSRDYFEQIFISHYYLRSIARDLNDQRAAKASEASLRFFATRLSESLDELEEFKRESESAKEVDS